MKNIHYIEDFQTWEKEFEFFITVKVRFNEVDMYGHLNNTVPFIYFEQARIEFLKHIGLFHNLSGKPGEIIFVVSDLQCDYLQQVFFDEKIDLYVKVAKIGNSSVDLHYLGKKDGREPCFTGRGVLVKFNRNNGKSEKWSKEEIEKLEKYLPRNNK